MVHGSPFADADSARRRVSGVHACVRELAGLVYTTIAKVLDRLAVYRPSVRRETLDERALTYVLSRSFADAPTRAIRMVVDLVESMYRQPE